MQQETKYLIFGDGSVFSTVDFIEFDSIYGDPRDYPEAEGMDAYPDFESYAAAMGKKVILIDEVYNTYKLVPLDSSEEDLRWDDTTTTMKIKKSTKRQMDIFKTHHAGLQSYDDIIKRLLKINKEEPDFLKWNLKFIDKQILHYIQEGFDSCPAIRKKLLENEYRISLRAIEQHVNRMEEDKLIIRIGGRPLQYKINSEIL